MNVFNQIEIQNSLKEICKNLQQILSSKTCIALNKIHTQIQMLFDIKLDKCESNLIQVILEHLLLTEKLAPGSFIQFLEKLISILSLDKDYNTNNIINSNCQQITTYKATENDLKNLVFDLYDKKISFILKEAITLAGLTGKIVIEKSGNDNTSIELVRGYTFTSCECVISQNINLTNPKIIVIDGFIDSVAEIHHLLESANLASESVILFARGMNKDIIQTLAINYQRKTLTVVPVIVPFELEGINTVNDIAIVSGCDLISPNKGNLISSIKYDLAPRISSISIYQNKIVIINHKTYRNVQSHLNMLKQKREDSSKIQETNHLLDKRIRTLIPNHVVIRLPDNSNYVFESQQIDNGMRMIKSLIEYGIIIYQGKRIPALINVISSFYVKKCIEQLHSIGAVLC
jgi:chaperonin GroEL (HSP60 family)